MARVVIPIPNRDFDPSEVAVPWQVLKNAGHDIDFATPDGNPGQADELMLSGRGLDWWGSIPGVNHLKLVGLRVDVGARSPRLFGANEDASSCDQKWTENGRVVIEIGFRFL